MGFFTNDLSLAQVSLADHDNEYLLAEVSHLWVSLVKDVVKLCGLVTLKQRGRTLASG